MCFYGILSRPWKTRELKINFKSPFKNILLFLFYNKRIEILSISSINLSLEKVV